jgi:hypothetical protein
VKLETVFKVLLFMIFGGAYMAATHYSQKARQFPQLIALLTLILIALSLLGDMIRWLRKQKSLTTGQNTQTAENTRTRQLRFYKAWLVILAATAAGILGGFLFSTFFLLAGFPLLLRDEREPRLFSHLSLAVVLTACIYLVFQYLMGVPLLSGLLIDL